MVCHRKLSKKKKGKNEKMKANISERNLNSRRYNYRILKTEVENKTLPTIYRQQN